MLEGVKERFNVICTYVYRWLEKLLLLNYQASHSKATFLLS